MYEFIFSVLLVFVSFHCNQQTSNNVESTTIFPIRSLLKWDLESVFQNLPSLFFVVCNIAIQSILASGYLVVNFGPSIPLLQVALALCFLIPSLTVMLPFDMNPLPQWCFLFLALHVAMVMWCNFTSVSSTFFFQHRQVHSWIFSVLTAYDGSERKDLLHYVRYQSGRNHGFRRGRMAPFKHPADIPNLLALAHRNFSLHLRHVVNNRDVLQRITHSRANSFGARLRNTARNFRHVVHLLVDRGKGKPLILTLIKNQQLMFSIVAGVRFVPAVSFDPARGSVARRARVGRAFHHPGLPKRTQHFETSGQDHSLDAKHLPIVGVFLALCSQRCRPGSHVTCRKCEPRH